ncbi:hypothetical protein B0H14DRAFT_1551671 [Mycena olivaceomarginata]|nr:hypothetical protein B0H14DRAFT_1551671 [Mycena olivaceomarginata]
MLYHVVHIFCRNCLLSIEPPNCPLCRRPFNQDRIKKLHVEPPDPDPERDLLHRLALAFDADTDEQARISDDLNAWLTGRPEDDVCRRPTNTAPSDPLLSSAPSPPQSLGRVQGIQQAQRA